MYGCVHMALQKKTPKQQKRHMQTTQYVTDSRSSSALVWQEADGSRGELIGQR